MQDEGDNPQSLPAAELEEGCGKGVCCRRKDAQAVSCHETLSARILFQHARAHGSILGVTYCL